MVGRALLLVVAWVWLGCIALAADPPRSGARAQAHPQGQQPPRSWFVGTWETRNVEFGRDVTIVFVMRDDGSLGYDFIVDGAAYQGSTGAWEVQGDMLLESWRRPDGSAGSGRATIEVIDDDTFRLTIIDNGHDPYRGMVRIYRRKPVPGVS